MSQLNYFEDLYNKANSSIGISKHVLSSKFEIVHSFLISESIKKQHNLLIDSVNIYNDRELFRSTVYTLIYCFFNLNFINLENEKPEIGNKYQRSNKRYKVIEVGIIKANSEGVVLQCISKGSDSRLDWVSLDYFYNDYIKLDADVGRSNRNTFGPIYELIKLLTNKTGNISSYSNKFAIICSKKHFLDSFILKERKAFPYEYVTNNEIAQPNLPLPDFMFYVANSYDAIVNHVLDKNIDLDLLVNIQNTNLRDFDNQIYTDRIKQVIHIGLEKPKRRKSLTWKWTFPEINHLSQSSEFHKYFEKIVIDNPVLNSAVENIVQAVKNLEHKYLIDLKQIERLIVDLFDVILLNDSRRVLNRIRNLEVTFIEMLESLLSQKLPNHGYDNEIFVDLVDRYKSVVAQISSKESSKSAEFKKLSEPQYILIPYNQNKQIWQNEVQLLHWHNTKIIDYKQFKLLEDISQVLVLGIHNKYLFYSIYGSKHSITWLLYNSECRLFEKYKKEFNEALNREFLSSDRYELTGIEYIPALNTIKNLIPDIKSPNSESISDLFDRMFDDQVSYDGYYGYENNFEHQLKRLHFTNGTYVDVSPNGLVIVIEDNKPILSSVSDLVEGELTRVYENHDRSLLFEKLLESDKTGEFTEILNSSNIWKDVLRTKFSSFQPNTCIIEKDFNVDLKTFEGWLKNDSKTRFPQKIENLKPYLSNFDYELVLHHSRIFKRIMIAAGRGLSDEVSEYIINGSVGKLLSEFDLDVVQRLIEVNAPVRRIKEIAHLS